MRFGFSPLVVLSFVLFSPLQGQSLPWLRLGAHGVLVYTHADPVPRNRALGELRLVQPALMAHAGAWGNRLRLVATLDLEGLTISNGELTPGAWGEGFIDRRHPHTYLHELMLSGYVAAGSGHSAPRFSLSAGKGFAPFGTDDPMARPVVRYPVNHHLAQILERAIVIAGARAGPVALELGLFNGDEPASPGQWPRIDRFGDSWSGRLILLPVRELEFQGSYAMVKSPEHRPGSGTDQHKVSVSGRWSGTIEKSAGYALLEWARTSEAQGFFVFRSFLAEGAWSPGSSRLHYRFERTERPEEERTLNPFRSVRPHLENSIQGITRWTLHTVGYGYQLERQTAPVRIQPFAELTYGRMAEVRGGLFDVDSFYGRGSFWAISLGVRLSGGMRMHRMGRYGVLQHTEVSRRAGQHEHHEP